MPDRANAERCELPKDRMPMLRVNAEPRSTNAHGKVHAGWLMAKMDLAGALDAELIEDEAHAQLRLLHAMSQGNVVVGAYLADAKAGENGPEPTHFREVFRTRGPSNYLHGKQAELN